MKKLLSIAFCLAMLITLPATAFASDMPTNNVNVRQASINEYEALKALSKESVAVLSEKGFSSAEISKIQNYKQTYSEHIMSLQGLPTVNLCPAPFHSLFFGVTKSALSES